MLPRPGRTTAATCCALEIRFCGWIAAWHRCWTASTGPATFTCAWLEQLTAINFRNKVRPEADALGHAIPFLGMNLLLLLLGLILEQT